jgi:hypothetical protein
MLAALRRVEANKGAPGNDGMTVEQLRAHLQTDWLRIKCASLGYPQTASRSPGRDSKPDDGMRLLRFRALWIA